MRYEEMHSIFAGTSSADLDREMLERMEVQPSAVFWEFLRDDDLPDSPARSHTSPAPGGDPPSISVEGPRWLARVTGPLIRLVSAISAGLSRTGRPAGVAEVPAVPEEPSRSPRMGDNPDHQGRGGPPAVMDEPNYQIGSRVEVTWEPSKDHGATTTGLIMWIDEDPRVGRTGRLARGFAFFDFTTLKVELASMAHGDRVVITGQTEADQMELLCKFLCKNHSQDQ